MSRAAVACARRFHLSHAPSSVAGVVGPDASASSRAALDAARSLLVGRRRIVALTGAGLSTESGIPDYRSPGRPPHRPTSHQQFMASHATRQRYWARSMRGYDTLASSQPNAGHFALSAAERHGRISGVITQNVDLLHEYAGSRRVVHLHGTVERVRCMSCEATASRAEFQASLRQMNPDFLAAHEPKVDPTVERADHLISPSLGTRVVAIPPRADHGDAEMQHRHHPHGVNIPASQRPDGDSDLAITDFSRFVVPSCRRCTDGIGRPLPHVDAAHAPDQPAGILKPDLVFFGANVPKSVHADADALVARADALLIAGTSLTVWSAFRLVRGVLDRAAPGRSSVVQIAEQMARIQQRAMSSGGNSISDGAATLSPVTPLTIDLTDPAHPHRVPATLPVVIVNHGPTRADAFLAAASHGLAKVEARTGEALHHLLDVQRDETIDMEREVKRKMRAARDDEADTDQHAARRRAQMQRHENIE